MNVRLVRSPDVDESMLSSVQAFFRAIPGPATFSAEKHEVDVKGEDLSWDAIFSALRDYRKQHHIPLDCYMVLLTSKPNISNWFSAFQDRDIFVHTAGWEYYVACRPEHAIAYEVVDNVYQAIVFKDIQSTAQAAHDPAIGCVNDMCNWKPDISLKFRTADICEGCLTLSQQAALPAGFLEQMLAIFEAVRSHSLYSASIRPSEPLDSSRPFPVAFTKRKLRMTTEPLRKFLLLIDHFDSLVRTSTLMLGRILLGKAFESFAAQQQLTVSPSLGHWVAALQALARLNGNLQRMDFALPADFQDRLNLVVQRATDGRLVQLRNERRGHGYFECHDQSYRNVFETCLPAVQFVEEILNSLLRTFELVYIITAERTNDDETEIRVQKLMGDHPDFLEERMTLSQADLRELPIRGRVYAVSSDMKQWHDLHDSIVYDHCPVCNHSRVLLTDGEKYLDPYAGHRVHI